jgi:hypothetical protein
MNEFFQIIQKKFNIPRILKNICLVTPIIVLAIISINRSIMLLKAENEYIQSMAHVAANIIDAEVIEDYFKTGITDARYDDILEILRHLQQNNNFKYVYITKFDKNGSHFIFDSDTSNNHLNLGDTLTWEDAFENITDEDKQHFISGDIIPMRKDKYKYGDVITVHARLHYKDGSIAKGYYAGIDIERIKKDK